MGIKSSHTTLSSGASAADGKARPTRPGKVWVASEQPGSKLPGGNQERIYNAAPGYVGVLQCDICGRLYGSDSLLSHKRLAHETADLASTEQHETQKILRIFKRLSPESKKQLLGDLSAEIHQI
jgi:hypothetical protein